MIDPAGFRPPACRIVPEELAAVLRECELAVARRRASRVPRVADPWPAPCRWDWLWSVTWGSVAASMLVWTTLLGWLLVQGVAWVLACLP